MTDRAEAEGTGRASAQAVIVAERFVSLAESLVDDFDLVELLNRLVSSSVELLEVRAAGILLRNQDRTLDVVASSDEASLFMEALQLQGQSGPCVEAVRTGEPVVITLLTDLRARWPSFAMAVEAQGYDAVYALPMRLHGETIGALNLFDGGAAPLSDADQRLAQAMADVATIGIIQHRMRTRAEVLAEQLQHALDSRIRIEQAKGFLAEYGGIDMSDAFAALRGFARSHRLKLSDVAQRLVEREIDPARVIPRRRSAR
jgi:GAF domain-containing protein